MMQQFPAMQANMQTLSVEVERLRVENAELCQARGEAHQELPYVDDASSSSTPNEAVFNELEGFMDAAEERRAQPQQSQQQHSRAVLTHAPATAPAIVSRSALWMPDLSLGGYMSISLGGYGCTDPLLKQALLSQWSSDWDSDMVSKRSRVRIPVPVSLGGYGRTDPLLKQALLSQWSSDWDSDSDDISNINSSSGSGSFNKC
ncbi:unnamed protein product [Closterium sp. NIES-54]